LNLALRFWKAIHVYCTQSRLALTPALSRREREKPSIVFLTNTKQIFPLLGDKVGVRASWTLERSGYIFSQAHRLDVLAFFIGWRPDGQPAVFSLSRGRGTGWGRAFLRCGFDETWAGIFRQRVRCALLQRSEYAVSHVLWLTPQLVIPKSQLLDAEGLNEPSSFCIIAASVESTVIETVQFYGKACFLAVEVEIVVSQWVLSTELIISEPTITKPPPH
jgi:hypothetical protein